jgi:hypothetical protein
VEQHRRADADGEAGNGGDDRFRELDDRFDESAGSGRFTGASAPVGGERRKSPMSLPAVKTPPAPRSRTAPIAGFAEASASASASSA